MFTPDVASQFCMGCGAPLPAGAQFCAYCGRSVPASGGGSGGTPLAASAPIGPPAAPPPIPAPASAAPPRPRRRGLRIVLIILLIVVVVIAALAIYGYYTTVDVTTLNIYAPDDVCGLNVYLISYSGFNASTGSSVPLSLLVPNNNTTSCTLHGVTTNSSGFGVEDVQLPGPIAGYTGGVQSNGTLNLTLTLPGSHYSGIVNLIFH